MKMARRFAIGKTAREHKNRLSRLPRHRGEKLGLGWRWRTDISGRHEICQQGWVAALHKGRAFRFGHGSRGREICQQEMGASLHKSSAGDAAGYFGHGGASH